MSQRECPVGHAMVLDERYPVGNKVAPSYRCPRCAEVRARVKDLRRRNKKAAGRHHREVLLRVPNAPLRERFERLVRSGEMTIEEIAYAAGYTTPDRRRLNGERADTSLLKRRLGLAPEGEGRAATVTYETAVVLCRALGIEYPSEVGV